MIASLSSIILVKSLHRNKMSKYKEISANLDLVSLEKALLESWRADDIFSKVNAKGKSNPEWVYYDGPITANGLPHYGHAITWTMKDILPRYYTMKGFYVSRNMGWDCQGILVEYEVEKKLGFEQKSDIEKYGIDKFNQACRDSVLKFRKAMLQYEERLGRWIDHSDEYSTMEPKYIESIWWSLKELHTKGLLYEGYKVVAYSTRAGMTLSAHEVADGGYEEIVDPAVTIKFKLKGEENTYFLAWTTTPWTLPGNLMLAVGKKFKYVKVAIKDKMYILAKSTLEKVLGESSDYNVVEELDSKDLVGLEYEPLFSYYQEKSKEGAFKVLFADHVNTDEGTGIVHLAPYGMEDFDIFMDIGITVFDYLDETGSFTDEITEYKGMFYKKANKYIIEDLKDKLFKVEDYAHQMPMCYRTKTPLIYRPIKSWYVAINKIKDRLVEEAKGINFVPELGSERFLRWIKNARDWSLSRKRYWGTPMPVWKNDETGEVVFVGSFEELSGSTRRRVEPDAGFDPHKPFVDEITWKGEKGGTFRRVPEVIDVWYDSGSMPFAQYHYPFENKELFEKRFPAEYISEGDDQIRLWFYTMFVLGVALFDKAPFKNVIVIGMLGDEKGKKMSKSKGNYPPIEEVFNKYGSDMLRYFLLRSPVVRGEGASFSYKLLEETKKEFFSALWNSYRYFTTYSEMYEFDLSAWQKSENQLDKWIIARLNETVKEVSDNLDKYEVMYATRVFAPFVQDLSTWYIRRSRDRLSSGNSGALSVLYHSLLTLSKLMAPFMPFLSEEMYKTLSAGSNDKSLESVHLEEYPKADEENISSNQQLLQDMRVIRYIASLGNAIRKENQLAVRQALSTMQVKGVKALNEELVEILKDELNIKIIEFVDNIQTGDNWISKAEGELSVAFNTVLSEELLIEGYARELMREIQKLRKQADVAWDSKVKVQFKSTDEFRKAVLTHKQDIMDKTLATDLVEGDDFKIIPN